MAERIPIKLKDRRVDKKLVAEGYTKSKIYYSPIASWLWIVVILLLSVFFIFFEFATSSYGLLLIPYFLISYLLTSYFNNSIAVQEDEFIVVNRNFPFLRFRSFKKDEIEIITFKSVKSQWLMIFMAIRENYILIKTKNKTFKFHCALLEIDGFDENWVEDSLDSLHFHLKREGFPSEFKIS